MREFSGSVAVRCMGWRLLSWYLGYRYGNVGGLAVDSLAVTASREGNGGCLIGTFLY